MTPDQFETIVSLLSDIKALIVVFIATFDLVVLSAFWGIYLKKTSDKSKDK